MFFFKKYTSPIQVAVKVIHKYTSAFQLLALILCDLIQQSAAATHFSKDAHG